MFRRSSPRDRRRPVDPQRADPQPVDPQPTDPRPGPQPAGSQPFDPRRSDDQRSDEQPPDRQRPCVPRPTRQHGPAQPVGRQDLDQHDLDQHDLDHGDTDQDGVAPCADAAGWPNEEPGGGGASSASAPSTTGMPSPMTTEATTAITTGTTTVTGAAFDGIRGPGPDAAAVPSAGGAVARTGLPRPVALRDCLAGDVVTTEPGETVVVVEPSTTGPTPTSARAVALALTGATARPGDRDDAAGAPTGPGEHHLVEVFALNRIVQLPADAPVTPVTDARQAHDALRSAVQGLAYRRLIDREAQEIARTARTAVLDTVRAFAAERHQQDELTFEQLNQLLAQLGLPTYTPRLRVRFTLTATYDSTGDAHQVPTQGPGAVRHLLDHVGDLATLVASPEAQVHIDEVTPADS